MNLHVHPDAATATAAAADWLIPRLLQSNFRYLMVAGGNTPLPLYAEVARRSQPLSHLTVFALDEYLGVPPGDPRTCTNLIRRSVILPWKVPFLRFHHFTPWEPQAARDVAALEHRIEAAGGLDLVILGLGRNGHLGFNEPGSSAQDPGHVVALTPSSIEANRKWFDGDYAPAQGITVGLRTILAARAVLLLAFGPEKTDAVTALNRAPARSECPASFLQAHPQVDVFLDEPAARGLKPDNSNG